MWDGTYSLQRSGTTLALSERRRPSVRTASAPPVRSNSLDVLVQADAVSARIERRLAREQRKLRRVSSEAAWAQYLRVEAVHMDRSLRWLELGATWAVRKRSRNTAKSR